jgi:hypothetical protein
MYTFETSIKRRIWYPIQPIEKKSFNLLQESMCTLYDLKSPKCKKPINIIKKVFLTALRFSSPFQNFMPDIWVSKSLVPSDLTGRGTIQPVGASAKRVH